MCTAVYVPVGAPCEILYQIMAVTLAALAHLAARSGPRLPLYPSRHGIPWRSALARFFENRPPFRISSPPP